MRKSRTNRRITPARQALLGLRAVALCLLAGCGILPLPAAKCLGQGNAPGVIEIDFTEEESQQPIACRVKILDAQQREQRARGAKYYRGWNLVEDTLRFKARPGEYRYRAYHGPQFAPASGGFTLDADSSGIDVVALPRHANLAQEGWFGGDLLSVRSAASTLDWLSAEDLTMAVAVSQQPFDVDESPRTNDSTGAWVEATSYHDDRPGSGLVLHHWSPPAAVPPQLPSSRLLVMAKANQGDRSDMPVHCEIQRVWARDVPVWLASGRIDSVQILSEHLTFDGDDATQFVPIVDPDPGRFHGPRGPGRLVEYIYWQMLESGLRLPPTAGSGYGKSGSPLGYNRVYAMTGSSGATGWWHAVKEGRSFVTSGPLLRAFVNGQPPGQVFDVPAETGLDVSIALTLTVSDPVEYIDVIFNGQSLYQARLDEFARQGGKIPLLPIRESGWMMIRVVTEREHTYRIATTAPYYFEVDGQPRVSARAVAFFQTWLQNASQLWPSAGHEHFAAQQPYLVAAEQFWEAKAAASTVD